LYFILSAYNLLLPPLKTIRFEEVDNEIKI